MSSMKRTGKGKSGKRVRQKRQIEEKHDKRKKKVVFSIKYVYAHM